MTVLLAILVGILFTLGAYLLMQRTPARLILGLMLLGNGANLGVFVAGGLNPDRPPLVPAGAEAAPLEAADPVPQALVLTAIVIGFGMTAFVLILALRARGELGNDHVDGREDDA